MKKRFIALLIIAAAVLSGVVSGIWVVQDKEGPEILFDETIKLQYAVDVSERELLQGVTAVDSRDGDVTNSLIVESIIVKNEASVLKVTYAAIDYSKNVTRMTKYFSVGETAEGRSQEETD